VCSTKYGFVLGDIEDVLVDLRVTQLSIDIARINDTCKVLMESSCLAT
jgi:hypothetical protein